MGALGISWNEIETVTRSEADLIIENAVDRGTSYLLTGGNHNREPVQRRLVDESPLITSE